MSVKTSPEITIIVPVYKVEQYLRRCLDSIVAQTFTDWECILIDDGSPDNCGIICDEYAEKDSRFRVIHQKNAGVSAARNAGLDVARGEWIGFVDSDDWIEKDCYETVLKLAYAENADVICFGVRYVNDRNEFKNVKFSDKGIYKNFVQYPVYMNAVWNKLFHKSLLHNSFQNISLHFVEDISICEDMFFSFQLLRMARKVIYIKQIFYNYFENLFSCTNSSITEKKISDGFKVYEQLDYILKKENRTRDLARFIRYKNVSSTIIYLIHPNFYSPHIFREKTIRWNIWTYTFRIDFFLLTVATFLHFDFISHVYLFFKQILKKGN